MKVRRAATIGWAFASLATANIGCAAFDATKAGVTTATSTVSDTKGMVSGVEGTAQGIKGDVDTKKKQIDELRGKKDGGGGGDPDSDGKRSQAKEAKPNEPITDNLDPPKGDAVDWRYFDLGGKAGRLVVEIHWDDESAILNLDVFDSLGANIATSAGKEGVQALRTISQIDQPQRIYVKVAAAKGSTDYTFVVKWAGGPAAVAGGGGGGGGNVPPPSPPPPPPPAPVNGGGGGQVPNPIANNAGPPPVGGMPPAVGAGPVAPPADDPTHPRAKIVQSYREGSDLILYLDKGSASQIKSGMTGAILEGDTEKLLDGGLIRISKVVDATHSIAKASITKVGKNTKVVINLVK